MRLDKLPYGGAMAAPQFCATGWQPSLGWGRPQKGRSKHFGSTVMGLIPLPRSASTEVPAQEPELWPELCGEGRLEKPGVCGSQAV